MPDDKHVQRLRLWPHNALSSTGFVWFIGLTSALITLPLIAVIGSKTLWALLPFLALAIAGIWYALRRNAQDRQIIEVLELSADSITLDR